MFPWRGVIVKFDYKTYIYFREWGQIFSVTHYRRRIGFENSIKFTIHTNESGHNKPHLHAQYNENEIVIEIPSGKIIVGNLPPRKAKQASNWVVNNIDYVIHKWNDLSNGIKIPVL